MSPCSYLHDLFEMNSSQSFSLFSLSLSPLPHCMHKNTVCGVLDVSYSLRALWCHLACDESLMRSQHICTINDHDHDHGYDHDHDHAILNRLQHALRPTLVTSPYALSAVVSGGPQLGAAYRCNYLQPQTATIPPLWRRSETTASKQKCCASAFTTAPAPTAVIHLDTRNIRHSPTRHTVFFFGTSFPQPFTSISNFEASSHPPTTDHQLFGRPRRSIVSARTPCPDWRDHTPYS